MEKKFNISFTYPVFAKLHHSLHIVLHILYSGELTLGKNPNKCA